MDSPDPPDPVATAQAQSQMNKDTAIAQYNLAATDITSPTGTVRYKIMGYNPDGTPHYEQTIAYSPEQQNLLDLQEKGLTTLGEAGVAQAGRVKDQLATPFSYDAGRAKVITDIQKNMLDPVWEQRAKSLEANLASKGIVQGSEAYTNAFRDFEDQRTRAYNDMFLNAYKTANDTAKSEYEMPVEMFNNLVRGPTAAAPQQATPTPGVAPADLTGLTSDLYKAQTSQYNAMLGAIGSAVGTAGGWAMSKYSDRRLKRNVELIGIDPRGWGVYLFNYIWGGERERGYMADEVVLRRPDAVSVGLGGYLMINYGALDGGNK